MELNERKHQEYQEKILKDAEQIDYAKNMKRLLEIGFLDIGHWFLKNTNLDYKITDFGNQLNVLYAFTINQEIKYIGQTAQPLKKRLYGYKNPGPTQSTNISNNNYLKEELAKGNEVRILAFADDGESHLKSFHINIAAGLEQSLIKELLPEWNRIGSLKKSVTRNIKSSKRSHSKDSEAQHATQNRFYLQLHKTYWNTGFFNVKVSHERYFADDGQEIDIFISSTSHAIKGKIDRSANTNHTPRIKGGTQLRDWFQEMFKINDLAEVEILSPTAIRIQSQQ